MKTLEQHFEEIAEMTAGRGEFTYADLMKYLTKLNCTFTVKEWEKAIMDSEYLDFSERDNQLRIKSTIVGEDDTDRQPRVLGGHFIKTESPIGYPRVSKTRPIKLKVAIKEMGGIIKWKPEWDTETKICETIDCDNEFESRQGKYEKRFCCQKHQIKTWKRKNRKQVKEILQK